MCGAGSEKNRINTALALILVPCFPVFATTLEALFCLYYNSSVSFLLPLFMIWALYFFFSDLEHDSSVVVFYHLTRHKWKEKEISLKWTGRPAGGALRQYHSMSPSGISCQLRCQRKNHQQLWAPTETDPTKSWLTTPTTQPMRNRHLPELIFIQWNFIQTTLANFLVFLHKITVPLLFWFAYDLCQSLFDPNCNSLLFWNKPIFAGKITDFYF